MKAQATGKTRCQNPGCRGARVRKQPGKGSFKGWTVWICSRCKQIAHMEIILKALANNT